MRTDELQDSPVLTLEQVLQLRGVNPDDFHFDVAILCFRGQTASRKVLDAFPVICITDRRHHPHHRHPLSGMARPYPNGDHQ